MEAANNIYFNTGVAADKPLQLRFLDGVKAVPGWIVAQVGVEELQNNAAALAEITFEEFITASVSEMSSEYMRRVQSQFIAEHTGRLF